MLAIYSDGAYDQLTRIGTYCIVVINENGKKDWWVECIAGLKSNSAAEAAGLAEAYRHAFESDMPCVIYCDSKHAIDKVERMIRHGDLIKARHSVTIHHIYAHTIDDQPMTDNIKYQHWADVQANAELKRRVDSR